MPAPAQPDALQLMLDCHERTRRISKLAQELGESRDTSHAELTESATRLLRYFTLDLPLHVDDEDHNLTPMLLETGVPRPLVRRMWEMGRQHEAIEEQVQTLVPLWAELRDMPERHGPLAGPLAEDGRRLAQQIEEHLALEEEFLFPAARERLSRKHLDRLAAELRRRSHEHP